MPHPRRIATQSKHVHLSHDASARIDAWARLQGLSFSAALETLARLGLQQAPPDAYAAPLEAAVRGTVRDELGRVTALLASASLDAHAAYLVALALAKQTFPAPRYDTLKQSSRLLSRDAVRRRASRQGLEQLAALLTTAPGDAAATDVADERPEWPS